MGIENALRATQEKQNGPCETPKERTIKDTLIENTALIELLELYSENLFGAVRGNRPMADSNSNEFTCVEHSINYQNSILRNIKITLEEILNQIQ